MLITFVWCNTLITGELLGVKQTAIGYCHTIQTDHAEYNLLLPYAKMVTGAKYGPIKIVSQTSTN